MQQHTPGGTLMQMQPQYTPGGTLMPRLQQVHTPGGGPMQHSQSPALAQGEPGRGAQQNADPCSFANLEARFLDSAVHAMHKFVSSLTLSVSACLPACLSVRLSACLSVCLSDCL